ncbi:helix-turn-helix domain-containing transcriptional regulator [Geopseudomonas aromaticivorans]
MTEQFTRWDTAEYLLNEADIAHYLEACAVEAPHDPDFIARAQANVARARDRMHLPGEEPV